MSFYTIKEAIRGGLRLRLSLSDGEHVVEPHILGRNRNGDTLLRAYQVRGPSETMGWKLFRLDRISHAVETGEKFGDPRPRYKPNDPTMSGGIIERL